MGRRGMSEPGMGERGKSERGMGKRGNGAPETALVTGAGGFIGSRLVKVLSDDGVHVRALVRRGLAALDDAAPSYERVRGDVTDLASLERAAAGCSVIYHCAWGGETVDDGREINVTGTENVIEAAHRAGVKRVVHLSTMSVHKNPLPAVLTEDAPQVTGGEAYALTKAEGERAAFAAGARLGVEVVALRPTVVYGPRSPLWVVAYFERVKNEQVVLLDGGRSLINLVYVDDVVAAMRLAAHAPRVAGQAFLVSAAEPVTWRAYLGQFAAMLRKPLPGSLPTWRAKLEVQIARITFALTQRPRRIVGMDLSLAAQNTSVSIDKARRLLGYVPAVDLAAGMARCEAWLAEGGYLPARRGR